LLALAALEKRKVDAIMAIKNFFTKTPKFCFSFGMSVYPQP